MTSPGTLPGFMAGAAERERERRVAREEKRSGYREGLRWLDGQAYMVRVSFYPSVKWHAQKATHKGARLGWIFGKSRALTPELWAKLKPLKLS